MSNDERVERELALLFRERRPSLLAQIDVIRDYRHGLAGAEQAREAAHRLAGTLGLFGFSELGDAASHVEADLAATAQSPIGRLDDFIERARSLLSG